MLALLALIAFAEAAVPHAREGVPTPEVQWWSTCGQSKYADAGMPRAARSSPDSQIVGGIDARANEFPWQVSMQRLTGSHFCGASIITPTWILTAAHCTDGQTASGMRVRVGEHSLGTESTVDVTHDVARINQHPQYSASTTDFDISLLNTATTISFSADVTAVCQPASTNGPDYVGREAQISGWGTLSSGGPCCPDILKWTWIEVITNSACQSKYNEYRPLNPPQITSNMMCAGIPPLYTSKDACQGDSGGPMTVKTGSTFELIGATSWGVGCADGYPGVWTNVPGFRTWVQNQIG